LFSDTVLQSKTAFVGETVHLPCKNNLSLEHSVEWLFQPLQSIYAFKVISGGHVTNGTFDHRRNITGSTLTIRDTITHDSGIYTCVEDAGIGKMHRINLTVQGR